MTILRLDLQAGGWRAVPPGLFEDERLSLDTRGIAGYISTRSESFSLSVGGLCALLQIGEDKWRRINQELTRAGYLKRIEGKDDRGRFRHELLFSPIPDGGFPEKITGRSPVPVPKIQGQPGTATPRLVPPHKDKPGYTRKGLDQISKYHHRSPGGGAMESANSELPQDWIDAANYEISIEQQARRIRNRGGLFKSIIGRYLANDGPDGHVIAALNSQKTAEAARNAIEKVEREQALRESEQAQADSRRHTAAEAKAGVLSREDRISIYSFAEGKVLVKANQKIKTAFVERGEILPGPLRRPLIQSLIPP